MHQIIKPLASKKNYQAAGSNKFSIHFEG